MSFNMQGDRLLKVPEVCELLGYSRATVYRLIGLGEIPVVRVAGTIRFRYHSVQTWMADRETPRKEPQPEKSEDQGHRQVSTY
ncbi:MAG: helix-turn-helix domain-containing protein [Acidobacteriota bacterium]